MNKTTEALKLAEAMAKRHGVRMCDENGDTHGEELYCVGIDNIADIIREALADHIADAGKVIAEPVKQGPVACQDSDDRRLLREIFMLCEATEEIEATNDFMRGRVFEAKGIRRGIGTWYQDTFCGRSYMGEPVIPAAPASAEAIRAEALDKVVKFLSESGLITPTGRFAAAIRGLK